MNESFVSLAPLLIVLGLVVLAPVVYLIATYNSLVRLRQHCRESWSGIDTELKRRYDLIPNLVETVRGYAQHERQVLQSVIEARGRAVASTGSPASQARDENMLVGALRQMLAVATMWALREVSGIPMPVILDTPLGRLDSEHRRSIIDSYFPKASHQVILLATDSELDEQAISSLRPVISRVYALEYDSARGETCTHSSVYISQETEAV